MTTTARALINRAARISGILASGETLSGNAINEVLITAQALANRWASDSLLNALLIKDQQSINAGGDTGQFSVDHGVIEAVSVNKDGDTKDWPIRVVTVKEWQSIPDKTTTAEIPTIIFFQNTNFSGLTIYYVWPVPIGDIQVSAWYRLGFYPAAIDSSLEIPSSIEDAFIHDLACGLCIEYGRPISPDLRELRDSAKKLVMQTNVTVPKMTSDAQNVNSRSSNYDINRGTR